MTSDHAPRYVVGQYEYRCKCGAFLTRSKWELRGAYEDHVKGRA